VLEKKPSVSREITNAPLSCAAKSANVEVGGNMRSTSTAQTRKDWLLKHMGKGAEVPATLVAVFVQDEDRRSLESILSPCEWEVIWTRTRAEAVAAVGRTAAPIIVCDERFADGDWRGLWNELGKNPCPPEFILASRLADERLWAELLNLGGYNLLMKPFRPEEVIRTIHAALTEWQLARTARSTNRRLSMPAHI